MVSTVFYKDLYIISRSTVAGEKEKQGPLGKFFDYYYLDQMAGKDSYEKGESKMIKMAIDIALKKAKLSKSNVELIVGGDLTSQLSSSNDA